MYTVCPKCALALAVAAADLRAGQGYVRCGRCANVFNALLGLTDEAALGAAAPAPRQRIPPKNPPPPPRPVEIAPPNPRAPEPPADEEIWLPTEEEVPPPAPSAARPAPPAPAAAAAPAAPAAPAARTAPAAPALPPPPPPRAVDTLEVEEFRGTGTFETIVLEGDTILQTEEQVAEEAVDIELADVSRRIEAARNAGDLAQIHTTAAVEEEAEEQEEEEEEEPGEAEEDSEEEWLPERPARPSALGITAIVLLALLLAAQGINHWRNDLATYGAWFGPLERLAAVTGESLHPNWDLGAYDVRQLGAGTDTADPHRLTVRLSLSNRGLRAQALPLLKLNLLDRYGTVVSSGELQPSEYLPAALHGQRFIASEQRIDTEVSVEDPTLQVSSFELDVCVPAAAGGLRCAGDTPVLASRK